ncbi:MAG: LysM peptidoglycan-binding domain-containing protein, partial [Anaerolineae bacterium]|nr:LysM peptidoglycan-binding domain-containing protein [Anaerolineae bacterium]
MHKRVRYNWLLAILVVGLLWPGIVSAQSGGPGQPMVHIVQRGDTLFSVARQCGTTVDAITYASGISDPRRLYVGQRLVIPGAVAAPAAWSFHWVRPGETLKGISSQYGLAWRTVALANQMVNPLLLSAGQVLQLPVEEEAFFGGALHTVQPGEMLSQIAFHYDLSLWELMEANGVANPALVVPGQLLRIPGERPDWMPSPFEEIVLDPLPVQQGEILWIQVRTEEPVALTGSLFDRPLQFTEEGGTYYALAGVHALADPGLYELTLMAVNAAGEAAAVSVGLVVEAGGYAYERIDVPPSRSNLLDPALVVEEEQRLEAVRYLFTPQRMWEAPFCHPVEAAISSYFGTRRSYNGGPYSSYHTGV